MDDERRRVSMFWPSLWLFLIWLELSDIHWTLKLIAEALKQAK